MHGLLKNLRVLLMFFSPFFSYGQTSTDSESWLTANTVNINNVDNMGFQFNREHFNQKTIIALGEPTHGTSEAQVSRHKLLEFLVNNCNVKFFAFEAVSNCEAVNEFLLYGKGTAKSACKALNMWMYDTEETEKLMLWIRKYNKSCELKKRVRFYGIDYAMHKVNGKFLSDSLVTKGIISDNLIKRIIIFDIKSFNRKNSSIQELKAYKDDLKVLADSIIIKKELIEKKLSQDYFFYVSYLCKTLEQTVQAKILGKNIPTFYRDSCMAENVKFISFKSVGGKVLVGGHNAHVKKIENETMGFFLSKIFGAKFYNIGIFTGDATFRAFVLDKSNSQLALKVNRIKDWHRNSLGRELEYTGFSSFYLDFESCNKNLIYNQLFEKPKLSLYAGWLYDPKSPKKYFLWDSIAKNYDAIIYFRQTFNSTPIN